MKLQNLLATVFVIIATIVCLADTSWAHHPIKVGIFQNKPIVYDENGPKGLFVEILNHVAWYEGWQLEYLTCELSDCINQLKLNELDLMTSVGSSPERSEFLNFSKVPVWTFWGTIYANDDDIINIFDLSDKKIGVRRGNKITTELKKLMNDFNVLVQYEEFDNYENAFKALSNKTIDAVAVNNTYGMEKKKDIHSRFYKTPVVFSPFSAYFAAPKGGRHSDKLAIIDSYVEDLSSDKSSFIYTFQNKWLGDSKSYWTSKRVGLIGFVTFFLTACVMFFWRYRAIVNLNKKLTNSIAESQQKSNEILKRRAEFEAIFNSITDAVVYVDKQRKVAMVNPGFTKILGYKPEEMFGETTKKIYANPDEYDKQGEIRYSEGIKIEKPVYEVEYRRKDGSVFTGETLGAQVENSDGQLIGFLGIIRDITEKIKFEEEKQCLENQLRQSQKMEAIGTMAGGIAHDFNNILSVIVGYSEMIKDQSPDNSTTVKDIDQVLIASSRASNLVKQILAFSRQGEEKIIPIRPHTIVKETMELLRSTIPTTVTINQNINSQCGTILADPTKLHQVVMNLCNNAVQAMEEKGTLEVSLDSAELADSDLPIDSTAASGLYVVLSVKDNGSGMDEETKVKMFDPFFTTKEPGKGTGMGLSVVHGIVKNHNGFITVDSELGGGSTFKVFIPVVDEVEDTFIVVPVNTADLPGGSEKILFVDDEEMLARIGARILEEQGYQVTSLSNSEDALEVFKANPDEFDLVITDQSMPGFSGSELALEILKIKPSVPIIICTGYSSKVSEKNYKELGISEFMKKPYEKNSLVKIVRRVLDEKTH